jgi:tetratricopeptide (TPR) repeat protein
MARFLVPGRSLVFGSLLTALVLSAQQPLDWDARMSDGIVALKAGHGAEAVQLLLPLPAAAKGFPPEDPRRVGSTLVLAQAYQYHGELDLAEPLYLEAIRYLEPRGDRSAAILAVAYDNLGRLRLERGLWQEAEQFLGKARNLYTQTRNGADPRIANVNRLLGETYLSQGRIAEGVGLLERALDMLRKAPDAGVHALAAAMRSLATGYPVQGRYLEAEMLLEESIRLNREAGPTQLEEADGMLALGQVYLLLRDTARALPLLEKAARILEIFDDTHLPDALGELGAAALEDGKYAISKEYFSRALEIDQKQFGYDQVAIALLQAGLAETYFGEGNYSRAAALIQLAIATDRTSVGETHFTMAKLLLLEANIEAKQRRTSEADAHYRQALDIYRKNLAADHPELLTAQQEYALFTKSLGK